MDIATIEQIVIVHERIGEKRQDECQRCHRKIWKWRGGGRRARQENSQEKVVSET